MYMRQRDDGTASNVGMSSGLQISRYMIYYKFLKGTHLFLNLIRSCYYNLLFLIWQYMTQLFHLIYR